MEASIASLLASTAATVVESGAIVGPIVQRASFRRLGLPIPRLRVLPKVEAAGSAGAADNGLEFRALAKDEGPDRSAVTGRHGYRRGERRNGSLPARTSGRYLCIRYQRGKPWVNQAARPNSALQPMAARIRG